MKIKISVPEVVKLIKELQNNPARIFEMIGMNVQKDVGEYLTNLMKAELTHFLGRGEYERINGGSNHRNGSYPRGFCIKGIGEVGVRVPRDRKGEYRTEIIPRSKRYEDEICQDLSMMFLTRIRYQVF